MKDILVKDLLSGKKQSELGSISVESTVRDAARVISDMRVGILVIFDEQKKFKGLISERDVARVLADHGSDAAEMKAIDVATKNVSGCTPDTELDYVLDTMKTKHFRHMPVMVDNQISGIISMGDILRFLLNERETPKKSGVLSKFLGG